MFQSNSLTKRILAAMAAGVMLVALPLSGCQEKNDGNDVSETTQVSKDTKFGDNIVVSSDNYKISAPVMQYLFNYLYQRFLSTYGTYYFDQTMSLKEQSVPGEENMTWYDYFLDYTKNYVRQTMVFAEAAKAEGYTITDEDLADINEAFEAMESYAAESSLSLDEFITKNYGDGVTKSDVESIQRMTKLAQNYSDGLIDSFTYTDDDYEAFYKENKNGFDYADYLTYSFVFADTDTDGTVLNVDEDKKKEMKEYADGLANCKTEAEYIDYLEKFLRANPSLVTLTAASTDSSVTEDDFNHAVEEYIEHSHMTKIPYSDATDDFKWVFEEGRKAGDSTVIESGNYYSTLLVTKPAYRDESIHKNVRHILIKTGELTSSADDTSAQTRSDSEAKAMADQIYKEWKDGEATEDSFAELARINSEDSGSASNGGLYENVAEGDMVAEFNDWIYDSQRKPGDTGIVKTRFGYHIMYFVGDSQVAWKEAADNAMRQQALSDKYDEFKEKYKVEFDDSSLNDLKIIDLSDSEESEQSEESE